MRADSRVVGCQPMSTLMTLGGPKNQSFVNNSGKPQPIETGREATICGQFYQRRVVRHCRDDDVAKRDAHPLSHIS